MSDTEKVEPENPVDPVEVEGSQTADVEITGANDAEQEPVVAEDEPENAADEDVPEKDESSDINEGQNELEEGQNEPEEGQNEPEQEQEVEEEAENEEEEQDNGDEPEAEGNREEEGSNKDGGEQSSQDEDKDDVEEDAGAEENAQGLSEESDASSFSEEQKTTSSDPSSKDENVQHDLLERQVQYIVDSNMLNVPEFQQATSENKITALVNMLNSNSDTAMPMAAEVQVHAPPQVVAQQAPETPRGRSRPDLNGPMSPTERDRYSKYLHGENKITEMHDIPPKSRLFIGNLPLKNVSKEDLFRIFSPYGHILQINIKNAFGFIQYNNPQSVRNAIQKESQEQNFGKKLILEISSSNARPQYDHGDHGTNSSSTFISSSKRPFQQEENDAADMYNDNQGYKKSKRRVPACVIYVKRTADRNYANEVFNHFRRGTELDTDMIFLKPRMELRRMINEVAHDGAWGVILVNKTRNVDIQTFYKGPQGETKFDEYVSISSDDAIAIFNNLKPSRGSAGAVPMAAANPYAQPPAAMPQQPPSQGYYGGYGMPQPMQQQAPPQPQQPYVQQGYGMPIPNQGYAAPPPAQMAQPYGRYQGSPPAMDPVLNQPQLSSLLGNNGGGQMNQQQLLSAIQNLPPNVVSSLLSMAQQQQQQQQPQAQQQLLGLLQSMQGQQAPQQQQPAAYAAMGQPGPSMGDNYAQHPSMGSVPAQHQQASPAPPPPQQQQHQQQNSPGNNVQSLLDSLAKLQK